MQRQIRTPTSTSTELFVTLHNGRKPLSNIKKSPQAPRLLTSPVPFRCYEDSIYASETAYSSLKVINRGRPCRLNYLLGTLPNLISEE